MKGRIIKFTPAGETSRVTAILRDERLTFRRFRARTTISQSLSDIYWQTQRLAEGNLWSNREPVGAPSTGPAKGGAR